MAFANGCFDLLHVGHVRYLQGAAQRSRSADRRRQRRCGRPAAKGPGRPILPAADRAELVAALRGVDYVVIFPEPTVDAAAAAAAARRALQGHRLHGRHRARARHRSRLRRPRRHRRRSEGSLDARPARPHPRHELPDRAPRRAGRHRPHRSGGRRRCAAPIPTRASTGSSTPGMRAFAELVLPVDRIIRWRRRP